jgi:hypothetical protein
MKNSIRTELLEHINESQNDGLTTHHEMFNEDYYIIGYYQSSQWLKEHGLGELEAVNICRDFEREHFGTNIFGDASLTTFDNTETLYGLELCNELNID